MRYAELLPELLCRQWRRLLLEGVLQMLTELFRGVVHKAVGEAADKGIAGVLCADEPLAHGQRLHAGCGHHITGAGIDEYLSQKQPSVTLCCLLT